MGDGVPEHYWKSLLEVSTKLSGESSTKSSVDDGEKASTSPKKMTEENRQFLEFAMRDMVSKTDPFSLLGNAIKELQDVISCHSTISEIDSEKIEGILIRVEDLLQIGDLAPQFLNNKGIEILEYILDNGCVELKILVAQIILVLTENNPVAQEGFMQSSLFSRIINMSSDIGCNDKVRLRLLGAVSSSVRSFNPAVEKFLSLSAHEKLISSAINSELAVCAKIVRILASIAYTMEDTKNLQNAFLDSVCNGYYIITSRDKYGEVVGEREYLRNFFTDCVSPNDISVAGGRFLREGIAFDKLLTDNNADGFASFIHKFA